MENKNGQLSECTKHFLHFLVSILQNLYLLGFSDQTSGTALNPTLTLVTISQSML